MNMILRHYGRDRFDPALFKPIKDRQRNKPEGGLWTSPINSEYGWREWCKDESFRECLTHCDLEFNGRLMVIDNALDLNQFTWASVRGCDIWFTPLFEPLLDRFDAIHLTVDGERSTRHSNPHDLYGWDCETVLILNPASIRQIP